MILNRQAILFISLWLWSTGGHSAQVVFFKVFKKTGELVNFEGTYGHSAIRYKGMWLHAHPYFKIQLTQDLRAFGPHFVVLENPNLPEPSDEFVAQQLSMKFNIFADWDSLEETYCSKLIGKALKITPTKMHFHSKDWRATPAAKFRGQLGLSPTDVYWHLRRDLRFKKVDVQDLNPSEFMILNDSQKSKSCETFLFRTNS